MKIRWLIIFVIFSFLLACNSEKKEYYSLDQYANSRIGVLMGSTQDRYITEHFPNASIVRVDLAPDLLSTLKSNGCDVAIFGEGFGREAIRSNTDVREILSSVSTSDLGVGFNLSNVALRDTFNIFLKEFQDSPDFENMKIRWFRHPNFQASLPNIPNLPTSGEKLVIGTCGTDMPYSFKGKKGLIGFDIELMTRFAAFIGKVPVFETMYFSSLIPSLISKRVDAIANYIMITPDRAKQVAFSAPYLQENATALAKGNPNQRSGKFYSIRDLEHKRISVVAGTTHDQYVTDNFPDATIIRNDNYTDNLLALLNGRCDATCYNLTTFRATKRENPSIAVLDSSLFVAPTGFGFRYEDEALKQQFNVFLAHIIQSGLLDSIINLWNWNDPANIVIPKIVIPKTGNPIRAGITGASPPFSFKKNNQDVGIDVEILQRFAAYAKRPLEFHHVSSASLIPSLLSQKVDIIASTLTITSERMKVVNFSDPYYHNEAAMVVLQKNIAIPITTSDKSGAVDGIWQNIKASIYSNLIIEDRYKIILNGLWVTFKISFFAVFFGSILSGFICFFRMNKNRFLRNFAKSYIAILQGIPVLILLMLLYYGIFAELNIKAEIVAIIAFALYFSAYASEIFRASIKSINIGQKESASAIGLSTIQGFLFILAPQAIKKALPSYKSELIFLIKMTSVVGYIAVEDLTKASDIIRSRTFEALLPLVLVALIYFLLTGAITYVLNLINLEGKNYDKS